MFLTCKYMRTVIEDVLIKELNFLIGLVAQKKTMMHVSFSSRFKNHILLRIPRMSKLYKLEKNHSFAKGKFKPSLMINSLELKSVFVVDCIMIILHIS